MEAQNHVHSGCCSRVRKPQNSSGSQSLIRMTRSQAPQLLPGNGQCDRFLGGGLPDILSTPLSLSLSTSGPFNIPKPKGVMGRGGPESVGGSPESVMCECPCWGWGEAGTALWLSCSIFTTTGPSDPCPAPGCLAPGAPLSLGWRPYLRARLRQHWNLHRSDFGCFLRDGLSPAVISPVPSPRSLPFQWPRGDFWRNPPPTQATPKPFFMPAELSSQSS